MCGGFWYWRFSTSSTWTWDRREAQHIACEPQFGHIILHEVNCVGVKLFDQAQYRRHLKSIADRRAHSEAPDEITEGILRAQQARMDGYPAQ